MPPVVKCINIVVVGDINMDFLELMALGRRYRDGTATPQDLLAVLSLDPEQQWFFNRGRRHVIEQPSSALREISKQRETFCNYAQSSQS